jgi:hypothetical protein
LTDCVEGGEGDPQVPRTPADRDLGVTGISLNEWA